MKRDLIKNITNEMSRQIVKRDLSIWKETYYRDLCVWHVSHVWHVWQKTKLNSLTHMSKETCIFGKRPNTGTYAYDMSRTCDMCDRRRTHAWHQRTRCCSMRTVRQNRFVYMKWDVIIRPTYGKRDVFIWKETWSKRPTCMSCMTCCCGMQTVCQKRHLRIKRDFKETYVWQGRHTYDQRDVFIWKETWSKGPTCMTCVTWTIEEEIRTMIWVHTYMLLRYVNVMSTETCIYEKRPNTETYV